MCVATPSPHLDTLWRHAACGSLCERIHKSFPSFFWGWFPSGNPNEKGDREGKAKGREDKKMDCDALEETLRWRYATKTFDTTRKIDEKTWATLEHSIMLAPSSFGLQPFKVVVVDDPETRRKLQKVGWGQQQIVEAAKLVVFCGRSPTPDFNDLDEYMQRVADAENVAVSSLAGFRKMLATRLTTWTTESLRAWSAEQAYIAMGFLLLSAALLRVDACGMDGIDPAGFDSVLGLKEQGFATTAIVTLGYRLDTDERLKRPKVRKPLEQIVQHV